jgi:predicted phosphodiesterase
VGTPRQITDEKLGQFRSWLIELGSVRSAHARAREEWGRPELCSINLGRRFRERYGQTPTQAIAGASEESGEQAAPPLKARDPSFAEELQKIRARTPMVAPLHYEGDGASLILLISDTHVGIGNNALEQLAELPARVALEASRYRIDEVVACVLGDICDGEDKYWGQTVRLEAHALEQAKIAGRALYQALRPIHHSVAPVRAYCVPGNHGDTRHSQYDNWDFIAYEILALLAQPEGIPVHYEWAPQLPVEVRGHRGMIQHGKWGHTKAPGHCGTAGARASVLQWASVFKADWLAWGHTHRRGMDVCNGVSVFRNGSLGGDTDYGPQIGASAAPCQLAIVATEAAPSSWTVIPMEWPC